MKIHLAGAYDSGKRSGHKCLCGRSIRECHVVILIGVVDGRNRRVRVELGSECAENIDSDRVQSLLSAAFAAREADGKDAVPF